jgi:hypothetical protein
MTGATAMTELLFALIIFPLAFAGLAVGVLAGRRGITGSCGGLGRIPGIDTDCRGACRPSDGACPKRRQRSRRGDSIDSAAAQCGYDRPTSTRTSVIGG